MTRMPRRFSTALALAVTAGLLLAGCVSTDSASGPVAGGEDASGPLVLQSRFAGVEQEGLQAAVDAFNEKGEGTVELNSIPGETFRTQLPSYLTAANPPDVFTWLAGNATDDYAEQGLLLDLGDVWDSMDNYPDSLRSLSQAEDGTAVFVPTNYYWWGVYYKKSEFEQWGVEPPATWDEFVALCEKIQDEGTIPIGLGISDAPWYLPAWFDSIDNRVNGGQAHLDLLQGESSYDSDAVRNVFAKWSEVLPYFDPDANGISYQQSLTDFSQGKTAMSLQPANVSAGVPADVRDDLGFFQFPIIDSSIPVAEEAPTDGFFVSARTTRPNLAKKFLEFMASPEAQVLLLQSQGGTTLPTNPDAELELDALGTQGQEMLASAAQVTQFFDRDAGDAQLPPASNALQRFITQPDQLSEILTQWESESQKARTN